MDTLNFIAMKGVCEGSLADTVFLTVLLCFFLSGGVQGQIRVIDLKPQKFEFVPKEFFINKVIDGRKEKDNEGTVIIKQSAEVQNPFKSKLTLKGGTADAIAGFIENSLKTNPDKRAVILHLLEFNVAEMPQADGLISGTVQVEFSFRLERNYETIELVKYKGSSRYTRSINNLQVLDQVLSKAIMNSLQYLDTWINREASVNENLVEKVNVKFVLFDSELKNDTLFYAADRPLAWTDFRSVSNNSSRFAAEIFPFFAFEQKSVIKNSVIQVELILKVYLVRNFSWVKAFARNNYTLNHEQRHFDIVKIVTERFKKKISAEKLTVDNYQGILAVEYLESLREMNLLQVQYDEETDHGTIEFSQEKWNLKIDKELRSYNIAD